ncbi:MAG: NADPH-dependent 7-cyano-7-deazaguanine reductase QueF [Chloroflexi bacterium]|nr:NADPH-dependent 7-cyano-7-deazaguanine reductase QueF [Chloroflexota bacterium]|tara:strand:- start:10535 stop:10948 length:414 start_codon:yes stop_codon:yes gene_type:complete
MPSFDDISQEYNNLDVEVEIKTEKSIRNDLLLGFDYEYPESGAEVTIDSDEFTAVCPLTGLPDFGTLIIKYVPKHLLIELKSLKYYLLSYTSVGIVQEHAANKILNDLIQKYDPVSITVELDYKIRGGLHTVVIVSN